VRLGALQATSADAQAFHIDRLAGDLDADAAAAGADARKASGEHGSDGAPSGLGIGLGAPPAPRPLCTARRRTRRQLKRRPPKGLLPGKSAQICCVLLGVLQPCRACRRAHTLHGSRPGGMYHRPSQPWPGARRLR